MAMAAMRRPKMTHAFVSSAPEPTEDDIYANANSHTVSDASDQSIASSTPEPEDSAPFGGYVPKPGVSSTPEPPEDEIYGNSNSQSGSDTFCGSIASSTHEPEVLHKRKFYELKQEFEENEQNLSNWKKTGDYEKAKTFNERMTIFYREDSQILILKYEDYCELRDHYGKKAKQNKLFLCHGVCGNPTCLYSCKMRRDYINHVELFKFVCKFCLVEYRRIDTAFEHVRIKCKGFADRIVAQKTLL